MRNPDAIDHQRTTVDQFTRQAAGFSSAAAMNDADALKLLLDAARLCPEDAVLDVACGPGIVATAVARETRTVVGIDLTFNPRCPPGHDGFRATRAFRVQEGVDVPGVR